MIALLFAKMLTLTERYTCHFMMTLPQCQCHLPRIWQITSFDFALDKSLRDAYDIPLHMNGGASCAQILPFRTPFCSRPPIGFSKKSPLVIVACSSNPPRGALLVPVMSCFGLAHISVSHSAGMAAVQSVMKLHTALQPDTLPALSTASTRQKYCV